jgi:PAS domain S-box-containing protein
MQVHGVLQLTACVLQSAADWHPLPPPLLPPPSSPETAPSDEEDPLSADPSAWPPAAASYAPPPPVPGALLLHAPTARTRKAVSVVLMRSPAFVVLGRGPTVKAAATLRLASLVNRREGAFMSDESRPASDERYRAIFRDARDAILVLDDARYVECNARALEMFGAGLEDIVGRSVGDLSPLRQPDGRRSADAARQLIDAALAGEPQLFEWRSLHKDGTPFDVEVSLNRFAVGGRFLLQARVRDITARKRAAAALHDATDLSRRLVHMSPTFIVAVGPDGKTVLMNQTMASALGYSPDEVVGTDYMATFVPESERPALAAHFARIVSRAEVSARDNHVLTRDGHEILCEWHTIPVFTGHTHDFFIGVGIDVTEIRRAAAEREKLRAELLQAQKMECVSRLAAAAAHDFNNDLSVVIAYGQLALKEARPGDLTHEALSEITQAGERAAALTRRLLLVGRQEVREPQVIDVAELLADLEKTLGRVVDGDIQLKLVLAPELAAIRADRGEIEQIVINLVVNARDAMPDGGELTIETDNIELDAKEAARHGGLKPGPYVLLSVRDTGCGMDDAIKARLFEPFFTTKPKGQGTGLGLPTVARIVHEGGGQVEADSEPGKGSTFRVYLPRLSEPPLAAPVPRGPARPVGGTETILIAEDDAAVRKVAARMLRDAGYTVLTAANGREALETGERYDGEIHLLLTAVVMPQMGGRQLAEQLRKLRPGLRVLFTTGYADETFGPRGILELGMKLITKPLRLDMVQRVREALDAPAAS